MAIKKEYWVIDAKREMRFGPYPNKKVAEKSRTKARRDCAVATGWCASLAEVWVADDLSKLTVARNYSVGANDHH